MKEELTGRVGCVKTHKIGDDIVQNFALCVEKIYNDGLPRLFTEWHIIVARNLEQVKSGDHVTVIGLPRKTEYIHSDGCTRVLEELIVERLTIHSHEIQ